MNQNSSTEAPKLKSQAFYEEKVLFRDPYAALSEIAASSNQASGQRRAGGLISSEEEGLKGGEAYRDPFDPGYWKLAPQAAKEVGRPTEAESNPNPNPSSREYPASADQGGPLHARRGKPDDVGDTAAASTEPPLHRPIASAAARFATCVRRSRRQPPIQFRGSDTSGRSREIVSLTDDAKFGMFAVGSAEPRPELIRVLDKIGPLLTKRPGVIIVRGHTDNRAYRSETYDNWRLSVSRGCRPCIRGCAIRAAAKSGYCRRLPGRAR
jgi:chemotaxis protein MotB